MKLESEERLKKEKQAVLDIVKTIIESDQGKNLAQVFFKVYYIQMLGGDLTDLVKIFTIIKELTNSFSNEYILKLFEDIQLIVLFSNSDIFNYIVDVLKDITIKDKI